MEIILKSLYIVFFIAVYILYYVNIHNTVKLLSDNNKFGKTSYVLAAVNIALEVFIVIIPVPKNLGMTVSRAGVLLIIMVIPLTHHR